MMNFREEAEQLEKYIIERRRWCHVHPELSMEEWETTRMIEEELRKMGMEPHRFEGMPGVWADLEGEAAECIHPARMADHSAKAGAADAAGNAGNERNHRIIMLRADIDALPVTEHTGLEFASENPGVMHACGHDNHIAMLLGGAQLLAAHRSEFSGTIRFLFQPAEEPCSGAVQCMKQGIMNGVDAVFGMHIWGDFDAPYMNFDAGPRMASTSFFTITVKGKAAHGSAPHQGVDAIVAAANIVQQIQTLVSRKNDPLNPLVVTIGKINGGQNYNVIADEVIMEGTTRTHSAEIRNQIEGWLRDVVEYAARANGAEAVLDFRSMAAPVNNDEALSALARACAEKLYGTEALHPFTKVMASEDFAYYMEQAPGVFGFLGTRNESLGINAKNHNDHFTSDESVLKRGAAMYAQFAWDYLEKNA